MVGGEGAQPLERRLGGALPDIEVIDEICVAREQPTAGRRAVRRELVRWARRRLRSAGCAVQRGQRAVAEAEEVHAFDHAEALAVNRELGANAKAPSQQQRAAGPITEIQSHVFVAFHGFEVSDGLGRSWSQLIFGRSGSPARSSAASATAMSWIARVHEVAVVGPAQRGFLGDVRRPVYGRVLWLG